MIFNPLGRSGIKVSAIGLGTMNFGADWHGVGALDDKAAGRLLDIALDAGVNLIDTADVYGRGASEETLGRLLGQRRSRVVLATKVCGRMIPDDPASGGLSRKHILEGLDASLRRLRTDCVDLYMAHAPDPGTRPEETLEAFDRAVSSGKARAVGCSNFSGELLRRCLEVSRARGWSLFAFNQVQFSLAARFIESDLLPVCQDEGVGVIAWSPLGGGFLTGKYAAGKARPVGRRQDLAAAFPPLPERRLGGLVQVLAKTAEAERITPAQAALGWVLSRPWIASAVIGARTPEQLQENLGSRPLPPRSAGYLEKASRLCLGL